MYDLFNFNILMYMCICVFICALYIGIEVHKRYDPIYMDARDKIQQKLGNILYIICIICVNKYNEYR